MWAIIGLKPWIGSLFSAQLQDQNQTEHGISGNKTFESTTFRELYTTLPTSNSRLSVMLFRMVAMPQCLHLVAIILICHLLD